MNEFILRDNEIAINRPDGTVIIMNLNAFQELQSRLDSEEKNNKAKLEAANNLVTALQKHLAEVKMKNQELVNLYNSKLERINDLKSQLNETLVALDEKTKQVNQLQAEVENAKKAAKEPATIQEPILFWGENAETIAKYGKNGTKSWPFWVYVTSDGSVFFTQASIEKKYNLPKGSVSAFLTGTQNNLFPRDKYNRKSDDRTMALVAVKSTDLWNFDHDGSRIVNPDTYRKAIAYADYYNSWGYVQGPRYLQGKDWKTRLPGQ